MGVICTSDMNERHVQFTGMDKIISDFTYKNNEFPLNAKF